MTNEGLGKNPKALKRHEDVTLTDGTSTVRVHKWSWLKFQDLFKFIGVPNNAMEIAVGSVAEADVERVKVLDPEDVLLVAEAAIKLNTTEALLKNLGSLLRTGDQALGAVEKEAPSKKPQ